MDYMFALYDIMQQCSSPITTVGTGAICSAAVLLLASGDKRYATENSWLMAHKATFSHGGDADTVVAQADIAKKYEARHYELMDRHTNWSAAKWKRHEKNKGEVWMKPDEMLEAGVIDEILFSSEEE
jgi:ATP-dependent protease ClpP protease subunit